MVIDQEMIQGDHEKGAESSPFFPDALESRPPQQPKKVFLSKILALFIVPVFMHLYETVDRLPILPDEVLKGLVAIVGCTGLSLDDDRPRC
jgi:hypothetical protein